MCTWDSSPYGIFISHIFLLGPTIETEEFKKLKTELDVYTKALAKARAPEEALFTCITDSIQQYVEDMLETDESVTSLEKQMSYLCYEHFLIPSKLTEWVSRVVETVSSDRSPAQAGAQGNPSGAPDNPCGAPDNPSGAQGNPSGATAIQVVHQAIQVVHKAIQVVHKAIQLVHKAIQVVHQAIQGVHQAIQVVLHYPKMPSENTAKSIMSWHALCAPNYLFQTQHRMAPLQSTRVE